MSLYYIHWIQITRGKTTRTQKARRLFAPLYYHNARVRFQHQTRNLHVFVAEHVERVKFISPLLFLSAKMLTYNFPTPKTTRCFIVRHPNHITNCKFLSIHSSLRKNCITSPIKPTIGRHGLSASSRTAAYRAVGLTQIPDLAFRSTADFFSKKSRLSECSKSS